MQTNTKANRNTNVKASEPPAGAAQLAPRQPCIFCSFAKENPSANLAPCPFHAVPADRRRARSRAVLRR